jgi:hypothetical protein
MRMKTEESIVYEKNGLRISRYDCGWHVAEVAKTGLKSRRPGEVCLRNMTYHPSLAAACEELVIRSTDSKEAKSLAEYARNLREATQDFRQDAQCWAVKAP